MATGRRPLTLIRKVYEQVSLNTGIVRLFFRVNVPPMVEEAHKDGDRAPLTLTGNPPELRGRVNMVGWSRDEGMCPHYLARSAKRKKDSSPGKNRKRIP